MADALEKRLNELALRAVHRREACFTRFLDPAEAVAARAAASRAGANAMLWGGHEDAERRVAAFYAGEAPEPSEWPIRPLRIEWNGKFACPGHRDLLGAVMHLGIERETTGDIAMGEYRGAACAYLFALEEIADYVTASLERAGRAALKVSAAGETPALTPPRGDALRLTVQQERLDAVLAAALNLSRSEAQRLVSAGLVKLNHAPCLRADARLSAGDMISVRGFGRLKVVALRGETRRGRLVMEAFRYRD